MSRHRTRGRPATPDDETSDSAVIEREDVQIRSYDQQFAYDLEVEVLSPDGTRVLERRYYLRPGQQEAEADVLPSGEYEIRATLDDSHTETLRCRVDSDSAHTTLIEVGNGALSLTAGP